MIDTLRARAGTADTPKPTLDIDAICKAFREEHTSELLALNSYDAHRMNVAVADLRTVLLTHVMKSTDTIPVRVIRRPTETVSALVVPEDGVYLHRSGMNPHDFPPSSLRYHKKGDTVHTDYGAIRRIDTDAPTTWIERTETQQPRAWQAGDVPKGVIVTYALGAHAYFATYPRADIAVFLNRQDAPYILVLPEVLP